MDYRMYYLEASKLADEILKGNNLANEKTKRSAEKAKRGLASREPTAETKAPEEDDFSNFLVSVMSTLKDSKSPVVAQVATEDTPRPMRSPASVGANEYGKTLMMDLQEILGIDSIQAAGIVGSLDQETGGFKFMQEIEPLVKGSRGGYGIAQWTGPRRKAFEAWAKDQGMDISSYEGNLGYLVYEFQETPEGRVLEALKNATTPGEAAEIFTNEFLRPGIPHMDRRINRANKYYEEVG